MKFLWFIPTSGDGQYLGVNYLSREASYNYFKQIAQATEHLGYEGVLIPTGRYCEDPWVLGSALAAETEKLKFLIAVRPGIMLPSVSARMAATFDRLSNGRLLINVVAGGDTSELASEGIYLNKEERYENTDEFLTIWRGLLSGEEVNYKGKFLQVDQGKQLFPPIQNPYPPLYFGGSSLPGIKVAAKHADTYLTWGEPPKQVAEKIAEVRKLAEKEGSKINFGIRLHVIVRETESEAWEAANNLIKYIDDDTIKKATDLLGNSDSEGQRRMTQLHQGDRDKLEVSPNLWAGVGLIRRGAGTALVGDPDTIIERLNEYKSLGIETFILSGYPHLEEAYRFAELVFPRLNISINKGKETEHGLNFRAT